MSTHPTSPNQMPEFIPKPRSAVVTITLPQEVVNKVDEMAYKNDSPRSRVIKRILCEWFTEKAGEKR